MSVKNKLKFEEKIWISFKINEMQIIGRTIIIDGKQFVACVDELGYVGHIEWNNIDSPKKLNLIKSSSAFDKINESKTELNENQSFSLNLSLMMDNKIKRD